jgi:Mg2+/Co2+ transporter CorC
MSFGFVKRIWNREMSAEAKKQEILDSLYYHCQTRTHTSKDVLQKLVQDLKTTVPQNREDDLLAIIRDYKNTGKYLEATIDAIYTVLYAGADASNNNPDDWGKY